MTLDDYCVPVPTAPVNTAPVKTVMDESWLQIGRIVAPHGIQGELRIYPESDFPERFEQPGTRWLQRSPATPPEPVELVQGRLQAGKNLYIIRLQNIRDRAQAEQLRGATLLVPSRDRLPLAAGEFHVSDLIGLQVVHQTSRVFIGTVSNLFTAGHDLLEVERPTPAAPIDSEEDEPPVPVSTGPILAANAAARTFHPSQRKSKQKAALRRLRSPALPKLLIPFVEEIVPVVDLVRGCIEINPPAGLIEDIEDLD